MASRSWNRVELIGNITRDPELRYTPSGTAVCTVGLATNRTYVSDGERKEEVDFHRLVAWNKLAELCSQLLKKGTKVFISGRLQYREWEPQEGGKRRDAEIVLEDMLLLTPKSSSMGAGEEMTQDISAPTEDVTPAEKVAKEENQLPSKTGQPVTEKAEKVKEEESAPAPAPKAEENVNEEDLPF